MNTLQAIGAEILKARKQQKLTQAALAAELGISRASLSALESGKVPELGIRKVIGVCARLNLDLQAVPRKPYPTLQELRHEQNR